MGGQIVDKRAQPGDNGEDCSSGYPQNRIHGDKLYTGAGDIF